MRIKLSGCTVDGKPVDIDATSIEQLAQQAKEQGIEDQVDTGSELSSPRTDNCPLTTK